MRDQRPNAGGAFRYTVVQGQALEAVGDALKRRRIDFAAATELRDLVRAGRVEEVMAALAVSADAKVTLTESAGYSDTFS